MHRGAAFLVSLLIVAAPLVAAAQPEPAPPPLPPPPPEQPPPEQPLIPPPPPGPAPAPGPEPSPGPAPPPGATPLPDNGPPPSVYGAYTGPNGPYVLPPVPPPPPHRDPPSCCRLALRWDPLDLISGRLTFQGEVAIAGPVTLEVAPSWIWGTLDESTDEKGFALAGNVGIYFGRTPLRGFWVKGQVAFETFEASLDSPDGKVTASKRITSPIVGALLGSNWIWGPDGGRDGGFTLSMGVGVGGALAEAVRIDAISNGSGTYVEYYEGVGRFRLLGNVSMGAAF